MFIVPSDNAFFLTSRKNKPVLKHFTIKPKRDSVQVDAAWDTGKPLFILIYSSLFVFSLVFFILILQRFFFLSALQTEECMVEKTKKKSPGPTENSHHALLPADVYGGGLVIFNEWMWCWRLTKKGGIVQGFFSSVFSFVLLIVSWLTLFPRRKENIKAIQISYIHAVSLSSVLRANLSLLVVLKWSVWNHCCKIFFLGGWRGGSNGAGSRPSVTSQRAQTPRLFHGKFWLHPTDPSRRVELDRPLNVKCSKKESIIWRPQVVVFEKTFLFKDARDPACTQPLRQRKVWVQRVKVTRNTFINSCQKM